MDPGLTREMRDSRRDVFERQDRWATPSFAHFRKTHKACHDKPDMMRREVLKYGCTAIVAS